MGIEKGGIIVLATKVSAIHTVQAGGGTRSGTRSGTSSRSAQMCGSRRYANAVAEHQWHTLSIEDNSKKMTLEEPRSLDDPAKEHTLKRIKPSEVHLDLFKNATEPLHYTALYLLSLYLLRIYLSPSKYLPSKVSNLVSSLPSSWDARRAVGRDPT